MELPIRKKDGRGGARPGAGRKSKSQERKLVDKLGPYEDQAIEILIEKMLDGDKDMLKLYFNYLHGTPHQKITSDVNQTVTNVNLKDILSFDDNIPNDTEVSDGFFDDLD